MTSSSILDNFNYDVVIIVEDVFQTYNVSKYKHLGNASTLVIDSLSATQNYISETKKANNPIISSIVNTSSVSSTSTYRLFSTTKELTELESRTIFVDNKLFIIKTGTLSGSNVKRAINEEISFLLHSNYSLIPANSVSKQTIWLYVFDGESENILSFY